MNGYGQTFHKTDKVQMDQTCTKFRFRKEQGFARWDTGKKFKYCNNFCTTQ